MESLGKGTFGEVFLVEEDGKMYVLKIPRDNDISREILEREANILQNIKKICKPYLVCLEKVDIKEGEIQGVYLEYIPGTFELSSYLSFSLNPVTVEQKFLTIRNLIQGLITLHENNVVHKDIKPSNLLFDPITCEIHYIDYGLSCMKTDLECLINVTGTLDYLSPVLARAKLTKTKMIEREEYKTQESFDKDVWKLAKSIDMWALGMSILELCFYEDTRYLWGDTVRSVLERIGNLSQRELEEDMDIFIVIHDDYDLLFRDTCLKLMRVNWRNAKSLRSVLAFFEREYVDIFIRENYNEGERFKDSEKKKLLQKIIAEYTLINSENVRVNKKTKIYPNFVHKTF